MENLHHPNLPGMFLAVETLLFGFPQQSLDKDLSASSLFGRGKEHQWRSWEVSKEKEGQQWVNYNYCSG